METLEINDHRLNLGLANIYAGAVLRHITCPLEIDPDIPPVLSTTDLGKLENDRRAYFNLPPHQQMQFAIIIFDQAVEHHPNLRQISLLSEQPVK